MGKKCDLLLCEENVEGRCTSEYEELCEAKTHDDLIEIDEEICD